MDIDRNGVVWTPLASGHLVSFDRRKCKGPLNGPHATGQHCPEGWTLYPFPGPQLKNVTDSGTAIGIPAGHRTCRTRSPLSMRIRLWDWS